MAAFSHHYHPFLVDSASCFIKMSSLEEENTTLHQETSFSVTETSSVDQSSKITISDTEISVVKNQSPETSMVENGEQVTQKVASGEKKRRFRNGSPLSSPLSKDSTKGGRSKERKKGNGGVNEEDKAKEEKKDKKKGPEEPSTGYIHVRARRGQATDSHSLAERVRREKISERMNMLQQLVPGCDKVTGKALVLEEIINYVQSLQHQVEFLSMKLASVNPMLFDMAMNLDTLLVRPEQKINSLASPSQPLPLPCVPLCSPNQATTFADATTLNLSTSFPTANHDYLLDYPSSDFLQGQRPNLFCEHAGGPFWDTEDQRQKFLNSYGCGNYSYSLN